MEQHEHPLLLIHVVPELGGEGGRVGLHVGQQEPVHLLAAAGGQGGQRYGQGRHQGGDRLRAAQAGEPTGGQPEIIYAFTHIRELDPDPLDPHVFGPPGSGSISPD